MFLDFGMMSEMLESVWYVIIDYVVYLVNRDYVEMVNDYYVLEFLDESVDVILIVLVFEEFFDDVFEVIVDELNFKIITDGFGVVLYKYSFNVLGYYVFILCFFIVFEGLVFMMDLKFKVLVKVYLYMVWCLFIDFCS